MKKFFTITALVLVGFFAQPLAAQHSVAKIKNAPIEVAMPETIKTPEQTPIATVTVRGVELEPLSGVYVVTRDVNVRGGPDTSTKRVAGLKAGERVRAIGKTAKNSWIAVSKDGETLGFVFAKMLMPVINGALDEQFLGSYSSPNKGNDSVACDYRLRFERKTKVEGANFQTADYEVRLRCASSKGAASFYGQMFLTEAPVVERNTLYLISLDVRSIGDGIEEFLTTRYYYDPNSGKMTFNGHSLPRFANPPKSQEFQTKSIKDALQQAVEASIASWTPKAWETLFTKTDTGSE